jgi:uncharacterized membrane protein YfcA
MAFLLGTIVGLALGLVGGGGSIITVPLLVGPLGIPAHEATTMSLVIVGVTAAWASAAHAQRGNVLWSHAIAFGAVGSVGTLAGGYFNRAVPARVLLGGFVVLMVVAAIATWRRASRTSLERSGVPISLIPVLAMTDSAAPSLRARARALLPASCPLLDYGPFLVAAVGVGLMTGFFGVGGGFLIVPALVLVARLPMSKAVGTSLPIIAINSATALAGHLGTGISFEPSTTALFTAGAVLAGLAGGALSTRMPAATLGRGFAVVVLTLAAYLSLQVV